MSDNKETAGAQGAVFDWRKHLKIHPAAELFPLMQQAELQVLADDIKAHGLQTPIVLCKSPDGKHLALLDGRNRLDAAALAGLLGVDADDELHIGDRSDLYAADDVGDPYATVLSLNVHRRHLTPALKDELIAKVLAARPELSNRQIGKLTKSDKNKVGKVRTKMESTGEVAPVEKTIGEDGKKRPAKKAKAELIVTIAGEQRRAERLGFKLRRRGDEFQLRDRDNIPAICSSDIVAVSDKLDDIEKEIADERNADPPAKIEPAPAERETPIGTTPASWKVIAIGKDGKHYASGVRLETEAEADVYRTLHTITDFWRDFRKHRIVVVATLAIPTNDAPNISLERTKKGEITHNLIFQDGDCHLLGWNEIKPEPLPPIGATTTDKPEKSWTSFSFDTYSALIEIESTLDVVEIEFEELVAFVCNTNEDRQRIRRVAAFTAKLAAALEQPVIT